MRKTTLPLLCASILAVGACTDRSPVGPALDPVSRDGRTTTPGTGPWSRVVEGETGPGSLYALYIPQNWNGEAIYYRAASALPRPFAPSPSTIRTTFQVRDAMGALGCAFRVFQFLGERFGVRTAPSEPTSCAVSRLQAHQKPQRNYLAGYSLGALVTLDRRAFSKSVRRSVDDVRHGRRNAAQLRRRRARVFDACLRAFFQERHRRAEPTVTVAGCRRGCLRRSAGAARPRRSTRLVRHRQHRADQLAYAPIESG